MLDAHGNIGMTRQHKRAIVGYLVYLAIAALAYGIMVLWQAQAQVLPMVLIFLLGYLAGRITKMIEQ